MLTALFRAAESGDFCVNFAPACGVRGGPDDDHHRRVLASLYFLSPGLGGGLNLVRLPQLP